MSKPNRLADVHKLLSDNNVSEVLLWGENAMQIHGIPAVVLRDDLVLNDSDIDRAAVALVSKGWREVPLTEPPFQTGFWMDGYREFVALGRRLEYPDSYPNLKGLYLLLLPRSLPEFESLKSALHDDSSGFSYPPAIDLADSIATAFSKSSGTFALLMQAWACYFLQYDVLETSEVDTLAVKNPQCWQELLQLTE